MTTRLITNQYKTQVAKEIIQAVKERDTFYYFFVGDYSERANSSIPDIPTNDRSIVVNSYRNMIFGKRIGFNDANLMIRYIPYEANTIYDMYDDQDEQLYDKNYYVITEEGSNYHIFKCLNNNRNAASTVQPEFVHITGSNTVLYQTSDGYQWKYITSSNNYLRSKFASFDYFPLVPNTVVEGYAVAGSIDVVKVEGAGKGYDNYMTGIFNDGELNYNGNSTQFVVSNSTGFAIDGFYTGCMLYLSNGSGAGGFRRVIDYYIESGKKIVVIDNPFSVSSPPSVGTTWMLYPEVIIAGDGLQTNAYAMAFINSLSSNSVSSVLVLENGEDYIYATANIIANNVVSVSEVASLRPIYSPYGGHGKNAEVELNATKMCLSVKLYSTEGNTVPATNKFQQIGILKNPIFNEVELEFSSLVGTFQEDETVYKIETKLVDANVSISTSSDEVESLSTYPDFVNQFNGEEYIYLQTNTGSDGQLITIAGVTNSSQLIITSNGNFSCAETQAYLANISSYGIVSSVGNTSIKLSNSFGSFETGDILVGSVSGAKVVVDFMKINGAEKNINTYVQLTKMETTLQSLDFEQEEIIYAGNWPNVSAQAIVHSTEIVSGNTINIYTSNQVGIFAPGDTVRGSNTGASALINNIYSPELLFGSGQILYLENISPVERSVDEAENFRLIFDF